MYTLENENLIINSKSEGAELTRIYSKNIKKKFYGMVMLNIGEDNHLYFFQLWED